MLGGGNTAMDCCRTSRRLGGEKVDVVVRSGFEEMKAKFLGKAGCHAVKGSPSTISWYPKKFLHNGGRLTGVRFEKVKAEFDATGRRTHGYLPAIQT